MSIINDITRYTKTPYTQYFCNADKGMKLRSGTIINNIKTAPIYNDLYDLYDNISLQPIHEGDDCTHELSFCYHPQCFEIINHLRFIERYHETIHNEPQLHGIYKEISNILNIWIHKIESGAMKCECWQCHSWRLTDGACMLTPEYEYFSSLTHDEYHNSVKNKENIPTHPSFYRTRTLHRLFHNNFLAPTEDLFDIEGFPVKKHDYTLILEELKIWQCYFRRETPHLINIARKPLLKKTKIVPDCIDNILEFL